MKNKFALILTIVFGIFLLLSFVSAVLLSDQGTDVKEISTGNLLSVGNITITIYDDSTAGNLLYNQTFPNAIANGSWNVMTNPSLEFGKTYWKNYEINGEDVDFDSQERLEFQSPLGLINNISFINFSLISSCSAGSSIRLIYENGSVLCETDDSGSATANLTDYALKNQSENFAGNVNVTGNVTTLNYGFFGWLGSLASRITKLFVQDIDVSGNISVGGNVNVTGNVTASYFIGNGSLLTGISSTGSSYNATYANYAENVSINYTERTYNAYDVRWTNTYNATYANILNQDCPAGQVVNGSYSNGTFKCIVPPAGSTYNASYATAVNNASYLLTYNATYDNYITANMSNSSTWWASISGWVSGWFFKNGDNLDFNETKLNNTIDLKITAFNSTLSSSSSMNYTNLALTNQTNEGNITLGDDGWFRGLFNWTVLSDWLSFSGSSLDFNETKLNNTINLQGVLAGFNSTYNSSYVPYTGAESNVNLNTKNITWTSNNAIYDNSTCVAIGGSTSTLYVC